MKNALKRSLWLQPDQVDLKLYDKVYLNMFTIGFSHFLAFTLDKYWPYQKNIKIAGTTSINWEVLYKRALFSMGLSYMVRKIAVLILRSELRGR